MKIVKIAPTAEELRTLERIKQRMSSAISSYKKSNTRLAATAEKIEKLEAEIREMDAALDPEDDRAIEALSAKKTTLGVLQDRMNKPAHREVPEALTDELAGYSKAAAGVIEQIMRRAHSDALAVAAARMAPFYGSIEGAQHNVRNTAFMRNFGPYLSPTVGVIREHAYTDAQRMLLQVEQVMAGHSPYKFKGIGEVPELEVFA
jgi:hypothetical protein